MIKIININTDNDEIEQIRNNTNECKVEFISNVISQSEIPPGFGPRANKIFYEINNGEKQKREWIVLLNNKFYCVYCVCFSALDKNRLIKGIEFAKSCRITDILKCHGEELHHKAAKNVYSNIVANNEQLEGLHQSEKRKAIECVIKIIIFIATHG